MLVKYPEAKTTIMFSHGNATDVGCMRDHLVDMAQQLKVNVCCYDYTGYGLSSNFGKPTVTDVMADCEAVYEWLYKTHGVQESEVILYGQSLGSGPTLHLALHHRVRGIVLHSGLMSGLRVIRHIDDTNWFDIFKNVDNVKKVQSPVFVIHGTMDEEIPIHHGYGLHDAAAVKYEPWFVEGAGHNNIEVHWRQQFFARMRKFLTWLDDRELAQKK